MTKRKFFIAAIGASVLGTGLHFLYDILPNPLTALISPINESVWEHLKLLFYPTLLGALYLSRYTKEKYRLWGSFFAAVLCMPVFLTGLFYLLKGGFGVESLAIDLALYYETMLGGFALAYGLFCTGKAEKWAGILLMLVILYGSSLILFTFAAPELPIFISPI